MHPTKYLNNIIIILLLTTTTTAEITYYWMTPSVDGEYIAEYPQEIRIYMTTNETIIQCLISVDGITTIINNIETQNVEINKKVKVPEGTHNVTINCTEDTNSSESETKTFNTNSELTKIERKEKNYLMLAYIVVMALLTLISLYYSDKIWRFIIATAMLILTGLYAITIDKNIYMWIPIAITIIWWIRSTLKAVGL